MISQKTLKQYGYKDIIDYFNYVLDSYVNGNFTQVIELFKKMNKEQRNDFIVFLEDSNFNERFNLMGYLLKN